MAKRNPYLKRKIIEVSARALFGKSEMDKAIEKWTGQGWELKKQAKVRNKNRYILTFEYQPSEEEIELEKRRQQRTGLGCLAIIAIFFIINAINTSQRNASIAATQTYVGTQAAYVSETAVQQSVNQTATATLWTPTNTPTPSNTPTNTNTPTITYTPSKTLTPTITLTPTTTYTPSKTPTITPSATITDTVEPSPVTPPPTNAPAVTYYVRATANARACEYTTCDIVTKLSAGDVVQVVGAVEGESVSGDTTWQRVSYNGQIVYVHNSLVSRNPIPTPAPVQVQQPVQEQPALVSTAPVSQPQFVPNCSGEVYDCGDLTCSQMAIYWAACPGDPSGLDGSDDDGHYCENKCGG